MNYRDLPPEAESDLVPDWVTCYPNGDYGDEPEAITVHAMDCADGIRLYLDGPTPSQIESLIPALQFFAANGRLPRRLGAEGEES